MKKSILFIQMLFLALLFSLNSVKAQTVVDIIVNSPDHDTLEAAVIAAGLADDLKGPGPFTVFAPTDAAFKALPAGTLEALLADPTGMLKNILLYHVASGKVMSGDLSDGQMIPTLLGKDVKVKINEEGVFINDAKVTVADIQADNGVVHVINAVLLPPSNTVVDIIANSPDHDTLEAAVIAAGLADDLSGPGPFTVFAPTDAAFKALTAGTLETLLADPTGMLKDILLYHVASGKVMSGDLSDGQMIPTLLGKDVNVKINEDGVFINDAKVTVADIQADNGVVHVINAVLIPSTPTGVFDKTGDSKNLSIHPNPASDYVYISGLNDVKEGRLRMINMNGAVVRDTYLRNISEPIDISSLQKGAYFLVLDSPKERFSGKLLVK
jgi:uncharacterized surface protein with fasciclin (FAS1) repeats